MNFFVYFFVMMIVMEIVSTLFYINPLLGILAVGGVIWFTNNRRKAIYSQAYQRPNYSQNTYHNANSYDTNNTYSTYENTNGTKVSKDNVFEAEYTEEDVRVH